MVYALKGKHLPQTSSFAPVLAADVRRTCQNLDEASRGNSELSNTDRRGCPFLLTPFSDRFMKLCQSF